MLKHCLYPLIIFTLLVCKVEGQVNLVVNPSFEDTLGCPSAAGEINKATGWMSLCVSPDYYNPCNANPFDMSVPQNWAGYQQPASGLAYAGFATYSNSSSNAREFPACNLSGSLNIGTKYFVSFKVALALTNNIQANCATNKIGAMFTIAPYFCSSLITNNPPIYTDSIITDSLNWTRISGSFVADSSYTYLVIGNFFDDANTDTLKFFSDFSDNAYYFLDDLCVSTDSSYANNYNYTGINEKDLSSQFTIYPNPVSEFVSINNYYQQKMDIGIYNAVGELLYSFTNISDKIFTIDLSAIAPGMLFITIKSSERINSYKLLKQ